MSYITNYQYYENGGVAPTQANHGSYQHVDIATIVNNYMLNYVGPDMMVDNVQRHKVRWHAKQCIKSLNYDAVKSIKVLETTIDDNLKLVMPHDYVNYVRISRLGDGVLYPMTQNRQAFRADAYLKDNENELLFGSDGEVLYGTSRLEADRLAGTSQTESLDDEGNCYYSRYAIGRRFGDDPSQMQRNPTFRVSRTNGVIDFDSTMSGETIVIEYISDGMEGGDDTLISVHKFFEEYMYAYITYAILDSKYGVADNVKTRARQKQRAKYRNARVRMSAMDPNSLLMVLRGQQKWIK